MIQLFTDFGYHGPYVGEIRALLTRALTHQHVVDLMHDAPAFRPAASACLLSALSQRFERGDIIMAVVDPGVGHPQRRAIMLEADGVTYVGPDNGLLSLVARQANKKHIMEVLWRPDELSISFHGRDLFAPVVVKAALRESLDTRDIGADSIVGADWPLEINELIYIDHYGNCVSGLKADSVSKDSVISIKNENVKYADVFSSVKPGELFWYINSMGLVEIACNQGSAASLLGVDIGSEFSVNS